MSHFYAGAATIDITPKTPQFLYGYPHVKRYSTGVHDPLLSSALCLSDGTRKVLFVANDIIWVTKAMAADARRQIAAATGIPADHIMITATHTHSGPITLKMLSNEADPVVPDPDPIYLGQLEQCIVAAALQAHANLQPAATGLKIANGSAVGTNRRYPAGPADSNVPVLLVRSTRDDKPIACMLVCSMHPTVLHEDSTLISGDFPGMARQYLQREILGINCPVIYHTGPAGNQSPRHVTRANTFDEARRLGELLGRSVADAIRHMEYTADLKLHARQEFLTLPQRIFASVEQAEQHLRQRWDRFNALKQNNASKQEIRTAEVDWFGAQETLTLAKAAADHRLAQAAQSCMPAEIQIIRVGPWNFVGWQGEIFIEYALEVKKYCRDTFVISLANGELQGYIVTEQAAREAGYEASNALFDFHSGSQLVEKTIAMIGIV
jgi:neutral ceramidase